jgi:superfamily II DNA helicase RecQ
VKYRFFYIPARDPERAADELNECLARERVVAVHREFVASGGDSFWAVAVEILDGQAAPRPSPAATKGKRIDYRDVLSEADFAVFKRLREWRKQVAAAEGVPVYTVFTNEQLAAIVTTRPTSLTALGKLAGIGDRRVEKYGEAVLRVAGADTDRTQ